MKVYYARSIGIYNTKQGERDMALLRALGFEVVDPNRHEHDIGYKAEGMAYFERLVQTCDALAFRANPDGSINAGVMKEIQTAQDRIPVFELPSGIFRRGLTVDQTKALLREQGAR